MPYRSGGRAAARVPLLVPSLDGKAARGDRALGDPGVIAITTTRTHCHQTRHPPSAYLASLLLLHGRSQQSGSCISQELQHLDGRRDVPTDTATLHPSKCATASRQSNHPPSSNNRDSCSRDPAGPAARVTPAEQHKMARRRRPPRSGALTELPPLRILGQIAALQALYYFAALVLMLFTALVSGRGFSLDLVLGWSAVRGDTTQGWLNAFMWILDGGLFM